MSRKPKILVVGSFVMDQIGVTDIFPREGQTVLGKTFHKAPGGKGANQAVQAARLGASVTMVGKLGRDGNGEEMLSVCKNAGIDVSYILYDDETPSGCALLILHEKEDGSTQNRIIVIPGTNLKITLDDIAFLKTEIRNYDIVMLQHEIPMEVNVQVAKYAHEAGVPVMLNPAPSAPIPDELCKCLSFISPNETEIEDITGIHIPHIGKDIDYNEARRAADVLRNKGIKNVLITLGSAGALLINESGEFYSPCVQNITAVDPTAAGDSFMGAFCTGFCCNWKWEDILFFANHTAAITVSRMGAMPSLPTLDEVEAGISSHKGEIPNTGMLKEGSVC